MNQLTQTQIEEILQNYDVGSLQKHYPFWAGLENLSYLLRTNKGEYVLRVFREGRKITQEIEFELAVLNHLSEKKMPIPSSVLTKEGLRILHLQTPEFDLQMALLTYLPGVPIALESVGVDTFEKIGWVLAELHFKLKDFESQHQEVIDLRSEIMRVQEIIPRRLAANKVNLGRGMIKKLTLQWEASKIVFDSLLKYLKPPFNYQVIHADLNQGNLLWENNEISGILDFGLAAFGLPIFDLAVALGSWLSFANLIGVVPAKAALTWGYQQKSKEFGQTLTEHYFILDFLVYYYFWREMALVLKNPENKQHQKNSQKSTEFFLFRLEQLGKLL